MRVAHILELAGVLTVSGCFPHVMHSPRIEDGVTGSLSLLMGRNWDVDDGVLRFVPSLYGGVRTAWVASERRGPALSLGLQVPPLFLLVAETDRMRIMAATSYLDAYVQPARSVEPGGYEYGIGALASTALVAPYLQVGSVKADGRGWYTTQLLALLGDDFNEGVIYLPSLVFRHRDAASRTAGNFSAGAGIWMHRDQTEAVILLGVTFELGLPAR